MEKLKEKISGFAGWHHALKQNTQLGNENALPGKAYFINEHNILSIPRDDGDSRYPYGKSGFNFWAYASGYMHCNEGLFSVFLRANEGQEPKVAFFAGFPEGQGRYAYLPLLPVPVMHWGENSGTETERYTVFSKSCVYYITEAKGMRFTVRAFPDDNKKLYFTTYIENLEAAGKEFYISTYMNPFLCHNLNENGESRWFREVRYICDRGGKEELGAFRIKVNEDISRTASVSNIGVLRRKVSAFGSSGMLRHEETASRYEYAGGSRGSVNSPASLLSGTFRDKKHICAFTEVGAAGDILHFSMGGKDIVRYDQVLSYRVHCSSENEADELLQEKVVPSEIDMRLEAIEKDLDERGKLLRLEVFTPKGNRLPANKFNSFFEHLKVQVEFCSLIKGYVQLWAGSLIGIRDIFQALEGLVYWQPAPVREKMLEAFEFIMEDGRCPRQYTLPVSRESPPVMDLRLFIDQGVWVISAVSTYIKVTGDKGLLKEICGYYRIVDEKRGLVEKSGREDTVLEHLMKIMDFLLSKRDFDATGCIRVLYGDWNDALDGLGVSNDPRQEYGTGVSVMATLQVYQNLNEMVELLSWLDSNKYAAEIAGYRKAAHELKINIREYCVVFSEEGNKRIVHGWGDKRAYFVGSFNDPDRTSRIGLTSNAFWVLSGFNSLDNHMEPVILEAFKALDTKYGFKTFEPAFLPHTPGVGRIPKLPAGTAENGAVYVHASAFAVMALFQLGYAKEAWEQLIKLFPFTHERISCSPFVMPNSYCCNEEKGIDGESMLDWQTGSSNVVLKTIIKYVMGIRPEFEGIWLQPAKHLPFEKFEFLLNIKGCNLQVTYENNGDRKRRFFIGDRECPGQSGRNMEPGRLWLSNDRLNCRELKIIVKD